MDKQKEIERLKALTYTDIYYEMETLKNNITELNQALQLQQTGVMRSYSLVQCGNCESINCSNNKKCIKCGVRFL